MKHPITITWKSVLQRLGRRLAEQNWRLMKHRHRSNEEVAGSYFIIDDKRNVVVEPRLIPIDLEKLARRLKAVAPYEEVER
jgi:hypothetical protein